ncbi:MAG: hypothetical protein C0625_02020 [Arcobacter sp.]|nr:MAG: hypothetical protein C0625_02020 [Arcobacter sp.]
MNDFLKGLQDVFIARVKNMLLLNFIIAWAIVNYDIMFFMLFDNMTISHKILYIQHVPIGLMKGLVYPTLLAAFYIYAIPFLNLLIVIPYNKYIDKEIKKHKNEMLKKHYESIEEVERVKLQTTEFLKDTMKLELDSQAARLQEVNNKAQEKTNALKEIENKEKEESIKLAKKENDEKERKIELAKEEEKVLNKEQKELRENIDLLKKEIKNLEEKRIEDTKLKDEVEEHMDVIIIQNTSIKNEIQELKNEKKRYESVIESLKDSKKTLEKDILKKRIDDTLNKTKMHNRNKKSSSKTTSGIRRYEIPKVPSIEIPKVPSIEIPKVPKIRFFDSEKRNRS